MKVCRVCLTMGVKMYHMSEHKLSLVFERVTGIELNMEDNLPKMLCWECFARLSSAYNFMKKALKTHWILVNKTNSGKLITISDIEFIDKTQLKSTLGVKFYRGDSSYIHIIKSGEAGFYESNYVDINIVEEHNFVTQDIVSAEKDPIKREHSDGTEEEKVEDEYNTEADISNEIDEFKFQNTDFKTKIIDISSNENAIDEELVVDNESNGSVVQVGNYIMGETTKVYDIIKQNWKGSEALPHCKELRVVLEDIMLSLVKQKTQDPFKYLKDNAQSAKDNDGTLFLENSSKSDPVSVRTGFSDAVSSNNLLICDKSLSNDKHTNSSIFTCNYCTFKTSVKSRLTYHTNSKHLKRSFNCAHCDFVTNAKCSLIGHINAKHTKNIAFNCSYCSYYTYFKISLDRHIKSKHTKSNISKSSVGNYEAYSKDSLTQHVNAKHTKSNVYACSYCSFKTNQQFNLNVHINAKHTKNIVFNCSYCSFNTYFKANLDKHINCKHTKSNIFKCSACNYKAYSKNCLTQHVNAKHTKTNVFACSYCSFKAYQQCNLNRHVNRHTKNIVFNCSYCSFKAYFKRNLDRHIKDKHTKDFTCSFCSYKAYSKDYLTQHVEAKHKKKVFICSYCNLQLHYKYTLIRHIKAKHS